MSAEILTIDDLKSFRIELINEFKKIITEGHSPSIQKRWLKTFEVRKMINISAGTLHNLRMNGTLRYTKIGQLIYYNYQDIEKIMNDNTIDFSKYRSPRKR